MGREQDAVRGGDVRQRVVGRQGLLREDVERRTGDAAPVECRGQRRLVDDAAARHVDEDGRPLHDFELGGANEVARPGVERAVYRDDVGPAQQLGQREGGVALLACDARGGGVADLASEGLGQPRHLVADGAQPDDAPARAVQLVVGQGEVELPPRRGVGAALDVAVVVDAVAQQRDGGPERRLGHRVGRVSGGVAHLDAQLGRSLEVDVVHPRRGDADEPERGQRAQRLAVEHHLVGDDDPGRAAAFDDLLAGGVFVARIVAQRLDAAQVGAAQRVFVEKDDGRFLRVVFHLDSQLVVILLVRFRPLLSAAR